MIEDTTPAEAGIYREVEAEKYHRWRAFGITTGLELLKSPGHYLHRLQNPIQPTPAMKLGTMVHMRLLEPERFAKRYLFVPEHISQDRRRKDRKEWEEETLGQYFNGSGYDKELIESEEARKIEGIYQSVMRRTVAGEIIRGVGEQELSLFWSEEPWLKCKGRLDKYYAAEKMLVDIKTTRDASPVQFSKTVCHSAYHIQAAQYVVGGRALGLEIEKVIIIAIETEDPFGVAVYELPRKALDAGMGQRDKLLQALHIASQKEEWSAYPDAVQPLYFPGWAFGSIERALGYY